MTNLRYIILLTAMLVILLFSGCEQDLNLNDYRNSDIENMLVVNSILNPDSLIGVSVTHPYFFQINMLPLNLLQILMFRLPGKVVNGRNCCTMETQGCIFLNRNPLRVSYIKLILSKVRIQFIHMMLFLVKWQ